MVVRPSGNDDDGVIAVKLISDILLFYRIVGERLRGQKKSRSEDGRLNTCWRATSGVHQGPLCRWRCRSCSYVSSYSVQVYRTVGLLGKPFFWASGVSSKSTLVTAPAEAGRLMALVCKAALDRGSAPVSHDAASM